MYYNGHAHEVIELTVIVPESVILRYHEEGT